MASDLSVDIAGLIGNRELIGKIDIRRYVDDRRGEPTLRDILAELEARASIRARTLKWASPRRRHRGESPQRRHGAKRRRHQRHQLRRLRRRRCASGRPGAHLGLSHRFIKDPAEAVKVGDKVVKVIKVEAGSHAHWPSIKQATEPPAGPLCLDEAKTVVADARGWAGRTTGGAHGRRAGGGR